MLAYAVTGHRRQTRDRGRVSRAQTRVGEPGARRAPGERWAAQGACSCRGACPPIRIGALTMSWGPTPGIVALRDGLLALGYREPEQFVLGVRFTQGDQTALPTATCVMTSRM